MHQTNYFTVAELVHRWKLSESNIRKRIRRGDLPIIRIGRAIRIETGEVERLERHWKAIQMDEDVDDLAALAHAETADFEEWRAVKARNGL